MKKIKKVLFFSLMLGFALATATAIGGCKKSGDGGTGSSTPTSSDWFSGETENLVSVRFASLQVDVYQYESLALDCTVKGTNSVVEYSSSDESVATVDANGNVTAKDKIGATTITATVDGVSASCTVSVKKSPYAPQIVLNTKEYTIEEDETLQFTVAAEWNKAEIEEEVEYAVSFAEDFQNVKSTISVEDNVITVVGGGVETFNLIVSATVRGIYTSESITVNVVESKLKLQPANTAFEPAVSGYSVTLSTTDLVEVEGMVNSQPLDFVAIKGAEQIESVEIEWAVDGEQVIVQDGLIVGQKRGMVTLTGTTTYEGEMATVTVVCNVIPPEVRLDQTAIIEVEALSNLKLESELVGVLQNAELHGVEVSSRVRGDTIAFNKSQFPKEASKLGAQELVINTDVFRYVMDVEVCTLIINDADEFDRMATVANTGATEWSNRFQVERNSQYFDGYFILGNDIDYNKTVTAMTDTGAVWEVQGYENEEFRGFIGIFDGKGYNIDGLTVGNARTGSTQSGGIFGYVGTGGIVRNVSFTNATLSANNGFICSRGNGTIENVSISYKKLGGDKETSGLNSAYVRTMGSFFSYASGNNATVRNCLVDASAADITLEKGSYNGNDTYNVRLAGTAKNVENVIVLCPDDIILGLSGADVTRYSYLDLIAEPKLMDKFDKTLWTTVEGIPMFVNQAETFDRDRSVAFLNTDDTLVAGSSIGVRADNPYVKIEVEEVVGVTYKNGSLSATEEAFGKTVTLTATSLFNPDITATHSVYIDSFGKAVASPVTEDTPVVYNTNPILTIGDNSWLGTENYVYLGSEIIGSGTTEITIDWKAFGWGTKEVTVVSVKDGEREHFVTDLKVWYEAGDFAESEIVADSAFSEWRGTTFVDAEVDVDVPEGYEKVTRLDSTEIWPSAMGAEFFSRLNFTDYTDIWFGVKIVNAFYVFQTVRIDSEEWIYFHFTQTSENTWAAEVTIGSAVYKTEFNIDGAINSNSSQSLNSLGTLLWRNGYEKGFLIYNRDYTIKEDNPTSVYTTEIRGIKR